MNPRTYLIFIFLFLQMVPSRHVGITVGMSVRESPVAYDNLHFFALGTDGIV